MSANQPETIDELTLDAVLSLNMPIHPEHEIDKRNIKAALSAMVAEIIGDNPDYGEKQPMYMQKIEAQVIRVKNVQRQRATAKGFDMKGGE